MLLDFSNHPRSHGPIHSRRNKGFFSTLLLCTSRQRTLVELFAHSAVQHSLSCLAEGFAPNVRCEQNSS